NASDLAPYLVPSPDRRLLQRRLSRLGRNALLIAAAVRSAAGGVVTGAWYPGLPGSGLFDAGAGPWFRGGYLGVELGPGLDRPDRHRRLVDLALATAGARGVPLVAGASFGF